MITMENVNILHRMAGYDFTKPIKVTMIFEDSDDESSCQSTILCEHNNNRNLEISLEQRDSERSKENETTESHQHINRSSLSLKKNKIHKYKLINGISNKREEHQNNEISKDVNDTTCLFFPNISTAKEIIANDDNTIDNEESLHSNSTCQINVEDLSETLVEDSLNTLSDHIILVMETFRHYNSEIIQDPKKEKVYNFVKETFFKSSFTTVETIILPQEQNHSFINTFLKNTVQTANSKSPTTKYHWSVEQVLPFFKDLVTWTKEQKNKMTNKDTVNPENENVVLKSLLNKPQQPMNAQLSSEPTTQSNLCIFSSGSPGKEISINIDTDILLQFTERQRISVEQIINDDNSARNSESTPTEGSTNKSSVNGIQKHMPHDRPPPPNYEYHRSQNLKRKGDDKVVQDYPDVRPTNQNQPNIEQRYQNHHDIERLTKNANNMRLPIPNSNKITKTQNCERTVQPIQIQPTSQTSYNPHNTAQLIQVPQNIRQITPKPQYIEQPIYNSQHIEQPTHNSPYITQRIHHFKHIGQPIHSSQHIGQSIQNSQHIGQPTHNPQHITQSIHSSQHIKQPIYSSQHIGQSIHNSQHIGQPIQNSQHIRQPIHNSQHIKQPIHSSQHIGQPIYISPYIEQPTHYSQNQLIHNSLHLRQPTHRLHNMNQATYNSQHIRQLTHNVQTNKQPVQNYQNMGQPTQYYQNIGTPIHNQQKIRLNQDIEQSKQNPRQTIQEYPTQVPYINTNHTSPSNDDSLYSSMYDNTVMHGARIEKQIRTIREITNKTSFNAITHVLNGQCYMCCKKILPSHAPISPNNGSGTPIYCSYLCLELDSQAYEPAQEVILTN